MMQINAIDKARAVNGIRLKTVCYELGLASSTLYNWRFMLTRCPINLRQSVDRVLGAKVDWNEYDRQFGECYAQRHTAAIQAADANLQADVAKIDQTPVIEAETEPEAQSGGWWSNIIHDDTADAL